MMDSMAQVCLLQGLKKLLFFHQDGRKHQTMPDTSLYLWSGLLDRGEGYELVYGAQFICFPLLLLLWLQALKLM